VADLASEIERPLGFVMILDNLAALDATPLSEDELQAIDGICMG
jgi:hypothetical protein